MKFEYKKNMDDVVTRHGKLSQGILLTNYCDFK
jgi:hypothetical protein